MRLITNASPPKKESRQFRFGRFIDRLISSHLISSPRLVFGHTTHASVDLFMPIALLQLRLDTTALPPEITDTPKSVIARYWSYAVVPFAFGDADVGWTL